MNVIEDRLVCPESGQSLHPLAPHLKGRDDGLCIYPRLANTWVLQADLEQYLADEHWLLCRTLAEFETESSVWDWFRERGRRWQTPDPAPIDSAIPGEGYPGYWQSLDLPAFVEELVANPPEDRLAGWVAPLQPGLGVDLGAGQGGMTYRMAEICQTGAIGIENNLYLAASANSYRQSGILPIQQPRPGAPPLQARIELPHLPHWTVVCANAYTLPLPQGSIDWLHLGHLIDLLDDPLATLEQLCDHLAPGALISIATPWDAEEPLLAQTMRDWLHQHCETLQEEHDVPWLRMVHARRFITHSDWLWLGRFSA